MGDITAVSASEPQRDAGVIKVQNEDELRLAQMGLFFSFPCFESILTVIKGINRN
jgi:hypothetical protein